MTLPCELWDNPEVTQESQKKRQDADRVKGPHMSFVTGALMRLFWYKRVCAPKLHIAIINHCDEDYLPVWNFAIITKYDQYDPRKLANMAQHRAVLAPLGLACHHLPNAVLTTYLVLFDRER